jgi:hypothetical protein
MTKWPAKLRAVRSGDSFLIFRGREQIATVDSLEGLARLAAGQAAAGQGGEARYQANSAESLLELLAACDDAGNRKSEG